LRKVPFSPPDITEEEINEVVDTLRSGWITTGPKTKLFEKKLSEYCGTEKTVCLSSCTAAMELTLRLLGIGPGDEVITSAYTYTASASVIHHVGAKIVLVDIQENSLEMDYDQVRDAINENTKAIIPVDIAGIMCDYDKIQEVVESKKHLFQPTSQLQEAFGRIIIMADAAHSLGATYKGKRSGAVADFTCFSFHAVKNLTTGEGGAVTWKDIPDFTNEHIYKEFQLLSLHGQSKDALTKNDSGSWEYDILHLGYKYNMTDIAAALGVKQLARYEKILDKRHQIIKWYDKAFQDMDVQLLDHTFSSGHLYLLRLKNITIEERNQVITQMSKKGISCNVHYKPLPMQTAYQKIGFDTGKFPKSLNYYSTVISLPLNSKMTESDVRYVIDALLKFLQ